MFGDSGGQSTTGGSTRAGIDADATSKQGNIASVSSLARQYPNLRFRAVQPGVNPGSDLGDLPAAARRVAKVLTPALTVLPHFTTPRRAAKVITYVVTDPSGATGICYDEKGAPMPASERVSDPASSDRYVAESRALGSDDRRTPDAGITANPRRRLVPVEPPWPADPEHGSGTTRTTSSSRWQPRFEPPTELDPGHAASSSRVHPVFS